MHSLFALMLLCQSSQTELEKALKEYQASKPPIAQGKIGDTPVRLIDIALDVMFTAGTSTARDAVIEQLQGGGHDPHQRGFNLTQAELYLSGAVDPYLYAQATAVLFIGSDGETEVELEEAFGLTTTLPVQLKFGHFLTEFGRLNPTHPHAWRFIDQAIVNTRMFGGDGMRAPGVRGAYYLPVGWTSEVFAGLQNARGETLASFWSEPGAGASSQGGFLEDPDSEEVRNFADLVWSLRWENAFEASEELTGVVGLSGLFGPNDTGPDANTLIYGLDLVVKWRPANNERGWPFVLFEAEITFRDYETDDDFQGGATDDLEDWGYYAQLLWGFSPGWAAGVRLEGFEGEGDSAGPTDPDDDATRDGRTRISGVLIFHPSEFSRLRLQVNHDQAESLRATDDDAVTSVWLSIEFLIGSHPPHKY